MLATASCGGIARAADEMSVQQGAPTILVLKQGISPRLKMEVMALLAKEDVAVLPASACAAISQPDDATLLKISDSDSGGGWSDCQWVCH